MIPRLPRFALLATLLLSHAAVAAPCPAMPAAEAQAALVAVNRLRAEAGLAPLAADPRLAAVAGTQACAMAAQGRIAHANAGRGPGTPLRQAGYDWRFTAENVGGGMLDLRGVLAAWMASPRHRANLMDPRARDFGIGKAVAGGDPRQRFWAAVVAAPR